MAAPQAQWPPAAAIAAPASPLPTGDSLDGDPGDDYSDDTLSHLAAYLSSALGPSSGIDTETVHWSVAALASVITALPTSSNLGPEALALALAAEKVARHSAGRDATARALATIAEAVQRWDGNQAIRLATEAAGLLEHTYALEATKAAALICTVAARERGHPVFRTAATHALARSLLGTSWVDAMPGIALLAPADMEQVCDAVAKQEDEDAADRAQRHLPEASRTT